MLLSVFCGYGLVAGKEHHKCSLPPSFHSARSDQGLTASAPLQARGGGSQLATRKPPRRWIDGREER